MYAAPRQSASPYDDAWRTLTVKASRLLIPMVNEAFGEHFSDTAEVVLSQNEHLIAGLGGETEKRITDTNFSVSDYAAFAGGNPLGDEVIISDGPVRKHYIFECESKPVTDRILIRIMEYAVASGLENALAEERDAIFLTIPQTAVLSLRCTENTPDKLRIIIRTEEGQSGTTVRVMKLADYTPDSIFEKKLYLLIPFLLFNYEKQFQQIQADDELFQRLLRECADIFGHLDALVPVEGGKASLLDDYTVKALRAMTLLVVNSLAEKYPSIRKGVDSVVGGNIILFDVDEARKVGWLEGLREGELNGEKRGEKRGKFNTLYECVQDGDIPLQKAAKRAGMNETDFLAGMRAAGYELPRELRA